ncbi:MAG: response regulator transcription factor [Phycisphaeraceae bacterium]
MTRALKAERKELVKTRVLLVDDHPIVRKGMAQLIEAEGNLEICGETGDAAEAISMIAKLKPDLAVIDVSLSGNDGIDLIKQIKARGDEVKVLVASMFDETLYAERALHAGAAGYINKNEAATKIVEAIQQVLRGKVYLSDKMTDRLLTRVAHGEEDINRSPINSLSDRELEVFRLIGDGLTTRQIAEKLHLSTKTIETYRDHIKAKLNLKHNTELIRRAVQWTLSQG